jgi:hypothetical protein
MFVSKIGGVGAGLICIAAGVYLLQTQAADENSLLEVIMHGMGIYFIGKGIFVWLSLNAQVNMAQSLRSLQPPESARKPWGEPYGSDPTPVHQRGTTIRLARACNSDASIRASTSWPNETGT